MYIRRILTEWHEHTRIATDGSTDGRTAATIYKERLDARTGEEPVLGTIPLGQMIIFVPPAHPNDVPKKSGVRPWTEFVLDMVNDVLDEGKLGNGHRAECAYSDMKRTREKLSKELSLERTSKLWDDTKTKDDPANELIKKFKNFEFDIIITMKKVTRSFDHHWVNGIVHFRGYNDNKRQKNQPHGTKVDNERKKIDLSADKTQADGRGMRVVDESDIVKRLEVDKKRFTKKHAAHCRNVIQNEDAKQELMVFDIDITRMDKQYKIFERVEHALLIEPTRLNVEGEGGDIVVKETDPVPKPPDDDDGGDDDL